MTEDELARLLDAAQLQPLLNAMTVRRGINQGQAIARLRDETRARLELVGRERALLYKTHLLTGLRKGELASLTVGQLDLDGPMPSAVLEAADEKNREGSTIAIRSDLATELRQWLRDMLSRMQEDARQRGKPIPERLPSSTRLFNVPSGLLRILDRDLKLAGIPKRDERGRTVDIHALRHTFGTHLSKAGVAPRTAQAAMRHSTIDLTMNVYTDPRLLDVHGALDSLVSAR
ncbi:MAG: site-specific integrase [Planctomycetales bacterium]|nr:site-specific integrase [Planctomycetales bacterium]